MDCIGNIIHMASMMYIGIIVCIVSMIGIQS